jgi:multidrug efflux system outer membrane protein
LAITDHTKNLWLTKSTNDLTFIRERVNDVLAEVRMDSAQSGVESAYATLMASLGEDAAPNGIDGQSVTYLADELRKQWAPAASTVADPGRRPESHAVPLAD